MTGEVLALAGAFEVPRAVADATGARRAPFDWGKRVVDGLRGGHAGLEAEYGAVYARRP